MKSSIMFLLLTCAGLSGAPPVVTVPTAVSGKVGQYVTITAQTDAKSVVFFPLDDGLNPVPPQMNSDTAKTFIGLPFSDGTFRLLVYSGNADGPSQPVLVTVTVAGIQQKKLGSVSADPPQTAESPVILNAAGACTAYYDRRTGKWYASCPK